MALLPPPVVLDELEEFLGPYRAAWPDLRWERRALFHVTVSFLGEVDDQALEMLMPRLERVAGRCPPLTLSFAGAGAFPSGGAYARVLWTGLYGDRRTLAGLAASVGAAARQVCLPPGSAGRGQGSAGPGEHKTFRPHLTLARCRRPTDVRPLVEALSAFAGAAWTAGELQLMRSYQSPQVRYETFRTWPLSDGPLHDRPLHDRPLHDGPLHDGPSLQDGGTEAVGTADDSRLPGQ
ncbi:MAG: 2-5 ligase [Streptosporangiaceae bacterium]|nr:2-5 ligase [Streptosporangiaceae bacterium]